MAGKVMRKRMVLAMDETTYADPAATPDPDVNMMLLKDVDITWDGQTIERGMVQPTLGNQGKMLVGSHYKLSFKTEIAGSGTPGTPPRYLPLWKSAGFSPTIYASGTTAAAAVPADGASGVFTYAATAPYAGTADRTMTLTCSKAGASGVAEFTVSSPARLGQVAYNAANVIMTTGTAFSLAGGATITPAAITTPFVLGDVYTIELYSPRTKLRPISDTFSSVVYFFFMDGILHAARGGRGTGGVEFVSQQIPMSSWEMTTLYTEPVDAVMGAYNKTGWATPLEVSKKNTPDFRLFDRDMVMQSLTLNLANAVTYKNRVNQEEVRLTNRLPAGSVKVEADSIGNFNPYAIAASHTLGPMFLRHGYEPGNIVTVSTPALQLLRAKYSDEDGDAFYDIPIEPQPVAGDDELVIDIA